MPPEAAACPYCGHPRGQPQTPPIPNEKVSAAYWLLPFFLLFIGGIVGYIVLKARNRSTATNILIFGVVWTLVILWIVDLLYLTNYSVPIVGSFGAFT